VVQIDWIDYNALWHDLVKIGEQRRQRKVGRELTDQWHGKAAEFNQRVNERWQQQDSSRTFMIQTLKDFPGSTVVDIGAGSGAWVSLMSPYAREITAVDPSKSMLQQLNLRINKEKLANVKILQGCWPEVEIPVHDICFCSHAMYGAENFSEFVKAMQKKASKRIIMLIRAPREKGIMSKAAKLIWGHPYDSPNYQIAINILWKMEIFPNVIMEEDHLWKPWSHTTIADALVEMKERLGLFDEHAFDEKLIDLLEDNLKMSAGKYTWPTDMRTALLYWEK